MQPTFHYYPNVRSVPERLSNSAARRVALAAQGFTDPRPQGRVDARHLRRVVARVGVLQIDSVNVVARSHELPAFSRLGPYPRALLTDLTERRRELFECWAHMASVAPVSLHPLLRWRMAAAANHAWKGLVALARDRPNYVEAVFAEVAERGPIAASELTDAGRSRGPWWGWAHGKQALEWLFWCGRLAVAGRGSNFERRYDLPERVLPAPVLAAPTPSEDDAQRELLRLAARSHGIGTAKDLADYFRINVNVARPRLAELVEEGDLVPVQVEGWRQGAFVHREAALARQVDARALLSPFDSLVWERSRTERIFGMQFRLEVYKPAPARVHGYYVLPFLLGDELVGRVDLKADRPHRTLRAHVLHVEPRFADRAREIEAAARAELQTMAAWLGLDHVTIGRVQTG